VNKEEIILKTTKHNILANYTFTKHNSTTNKIFLTFTIIIFIAKYAAGPIIICSVGLKFEMKMKVLLQLRYV